MLTSQELIGILCLVGLFLAFIFNFRKYSGVRSDTRLHLKKATRSLPTQGVLDPATSQEQDVVGRTRRLTVLFMYNGHSFEAHEILGVPPGAGAKTIDEAYQRLKQSQSAEAMEFIDTAYRALKKNG